MFWPRDMIQRHSDWSFKNHVDSQPWQTEHNRPQSSHRPEQNHSFDFSDSGYNNYHYQPSQTGNPESSAVPQQSLDDLATLFVDLLKTIFSQFFGKGNSDESGGGYDPDLTTDSSAPYVPNQGAAPYSPQVNDSTGSTGAPNVMPEVYDKTGAYKSAPVTGGGSQVTSTLPANSDAGLQSGFLSRPDNPHFIKHDSALSPQKTAVVNALEANDATELEKHTIVAMLMQEGPDGRVMTDPEGNSSAFNMSDALMARMLGKEQLTDGDRAYYDNPDNIGEVAKLIQQSMRSPEMTDGYYQGDAFSNTLLWFRGGETAYHDGHSYGAQDYIEGMGTVVNHMSQDGPQSLTSSTRYAINAEGLPQV